MPYLLDSGFFIQAHRFHYPMDVWPSFWQKVKELAEQQHIISIDKVYDELNQVEDVLSEWCSNNLPGGFFKSTAETITNYGQVISWASAPGTQYSTAAIHVFAEAHRADAWLVSYAMSQSAIVVTQEVSSPSSKKSIKLPDACNHFTVPHVNTLGMLRGLGVVL
jgi:uncharacterized membrane protein